MVGSLNGKCCVLDFDQKNRADLSLRRAVNDFNAKVERAVTPINDIVRQEITEYANGDRTSFSFPIQFGGTDFQKKVWSALQEIPYGHTISYRELAIKIGNPNGFRAVAQANGRNTIAIAVPCHRVIASNGSLSGYGAGTPIKKLLLDLEGASYSDKDK